MGRHPSQAPVCAPPCPRPPGLLTAINHPPHHGKAFPQPLPLGPPCQALPKSITSPNQKAAPINHRISGPSSLDPSVPLLISNYLSSGCPLPPSSSTEISLGARERAWGGGDWGAQALPPRQCRGPTPAAVSLRPLVCCVTLGRGLLSEPPPGLEQMSQGQFQQRGGISASSDHFRSAATGTGKMNPRAACPSICSSVVSHRRHGACLRGRRSGAWGGRHTDTAAFPRRLFTRDPAAAGPANLRAQVPLACVSQSPCESPQEEAPRGPRPTFRERALIGVHAPPSSPHRPRDGIFQSLISHL